MAIIWADFPSGQQGLYGTTASHLLDGIWIEANKVQITNDPDPNIGSSGKVAFITHGVTSGTCVLRIPLPTVELTAGVGLRFWIPALPPSTDVLPNPIVFRNGSNGDIATVRVETDGRISAYRGNGESGTLLATSTNPVVTANAWHHIEAKLFADASVGTFEIRVNGITVVDFEGNTGSGSISQIACRENNTVTNASRTFYIKDFVLWDTNGSLGNDFQGSVAVHDLYTDGDISLNWTPSTGSTGWDLLDEIPPSDLDYIQAADPPPSPAVFSLTDLPEDVTSVRALLPIVRAVKTDGGDCNIQASLTPDNSNWFDGDDRPITTAYTYWWDVSHTSPATAAPWTPVEVNAAYVKVNRTL